MVDPMNWFYAGRDTLMTHQMLSQIDIGRNRFHRHPLYRRWSHYAYNNPIAQYAELLTERFAEYGPALTILLPLMFALAALLFGKDGFTVAFTLTAIVFLAAAVVVILGSLCVAAGLSAYAVARERLEGRWDLIMLIPKDRSSILWMRVSSILNPYRPTMITFEVLQNALAMLAVFVVSLNDVDDSRLGICLAFFIPALFLLTWERHQDYALAVAMGAFLGLKYDDRRAFSISLAGVGFILMARAVFVMVAYGISTPPGGMDVIVPSLIGGVTMLPMAGIPLWACAVGGFSYFAAREAAIAYFRHASLHLMDNPPL